MDPGGVGSAFRLFFCHGHCGFGCGCLASEGNAGPNGPHGQAATTAGPHDSLTAAETEAEVTTAAGSDAITVCNKARTTTKK